MRQSRARKEMVKDWRFMFINQRSLLLLFERILALLPGFPKLNIQLFYRASDLSELIEEVLR